VIIALTLTLRPAAVFLRILNTVDGAWFAVLAIVLVCVNRRTGTVWAWRVVRLIHALPFVAGAYAFGAVATIVWRASLPVHLGGAACASIVVIEFAAIWWRQWWRG
jgi:hypothetical protein